MGINMKQTMIVYADEGVDGEGLKQLIRSLQQEVDPERCTIQRMDARRLLQESWEDEASLLIMPGGRDVFYHAALNGAGTDKIRAFVQEGGRYLGICAGAYFACQEIEFEKGGVMEVCGSRSLRLFPGIAKGPAYGSNKYSPETAKGVEAALISSPDGECHVYFNGGCVFEAEDHYPWVKTIGHYLDLPGKPPAVLEIEVGKGRALLTGVHIEYAPRLLNRENPYLSRVIPILEQAEPARRKLFRSYLQKLDVALNFVTDLRY
jgi:glutamine amidotransferase-like uncharacterized protein